MTIKMFHLTTFAIALSLSYSSTASLTEPTVRNNRFLIVPTTFTSTVLNTKTTTSFTSSTALCYKTVAGIPGCRRRRYNDVEQPFIVNADEFQPSEPLLVVPTAAPAGAKALFSVTKRKLVGQRVSYPVELASSMPISVGIAEVRFSNLDSFCRARIASPQLNSLAAVAIEALGITVAYSTIVTSTVTKTFTSPVIALEKTVTFDGCNPSQFVTITPCK